MRVLFFNPEQYVPFEQEPSNVQLRLPILNCGAVSGHRDHVYQRDLRSAGREAMDRRALEAVAAFRPDLVVYSATWEHENLSPWVLRTIRDDGPGKPGIPVVSMLWDSWIAPTTAEAELLANSTVLVVGDSLHTYLRCRLAVEALRPAPKVAFFGGQVFTDLVRPLADEPVLFDVTLLGSNEGRRARLVARLAEELPRHGIRFNKAGGLVDSSKGGFALTDAWVSWDEYVRIINRSRLCLNSATDPTRLQIKGKIFDYMACGVACLTDGNVETRRFIPDGAVALFEDEEDCIAQILRLLGDDAERARIAEAGHRWLTETFDYRRFWSGVLEAALGRGPVPTLPLLESLAADAREGQAALLRTALDGAGRAASWAVARRQADGGSDEGVVRRAALTWFGRHGSYYCLGLEDGRLLATSRMPVDVLVTDRACHAVIAGCGEGRLAEKGWTRLGSARILLGSSLEELHARIDEEAVG